ncbi:MAG: hypothetical protein GY866_24170 [Proteobacteria bacterium]|nr:hypothetical protein [Pseudomonadota bacterium]
MYSIKTATFDMFETSTEGRKLMTTAGRTEYDVSKAFRLEPRRWEDDQGNPFAIFIFSEPTPGCLPGRRDDKQCGFAVRLPWKADFQVDTQEEFVYLMNSNSLNDANPRFEPDRSRRCGLVQLE